MIKKLKLTFIIIFFYLLLINVSNANLQEKIISKLKEVKTLSFDFKQKISDKEEVGICFIKYPLLMKCNYKNLKQKTIISNGKSVAIIKRKYKKIYRYPVKSTPLFIILKKQEIIKLIRKHPPTEIRANLIKFEFIDKKKNIYFSYSFHIPDFCNCCFRRFKKSYQ